MLGCSTNSILKGDFSFRQLLFFGSVENLKYTGRMGFHFTRFTFRLFYYIFFFHSCLDLYFCFQRHIPRYVPTPRCTRTLNFYGLINLGAQLRLWDVGLYVCMCFHGCFTLRRLRVFSSLKRLENTINVTTSGYHRNLSAEQVESRRTGSSRATLPYKALVHTTTDM